MEGAETKGEARAKGVGVKGLVVAGAAVALIGVVALAARAAQSPGPEAAIAQSTALQGQALAAAPTAPKGIPDQATIDHYMTIGQTRYGASFMTPADARDPEMRRLATYYLMVDEELDRRKAAAGGGRRGDAVKMSFVEVEAFLGSAAYADQEALAAKVKAKGP